MTSRVRLFPAVLLALILLAEAYGRVTGVSDRPFWSDEAWVAKKALELPYGQLSRQQDVPIPPLFSVAVKAFNSLTARPELGLRLFPLLCGLGVPLVTYFIMRMLRAPRSDVGGPHAAGDGCRPCENRPNMFAYRVRPPAGPDQDLTFARRRKVSWRTWDPAVCRVRLHRVRTWPSRSCPRRCQAGLNRCCQYGRSTCRHRWARRPGR